MAGQDQLVMAAISVTCLRC